MKSSIRKRTYSAIYKLLDMVSPINADCGELCGAICCTYADMAETEAMGIYLLPGEEKVFEGAHELMDWQTDLAENYDFPESWFGKIYFVRCKNPPCCLRSMRPIQCRTFPVLPYLTAQGELVLIHNDLDLPYNCPLISEDIRLSPPFLHATHTAWKHLAKDKLIHDLIEYDSSFRDESRINIVYKVKSRFYSSSSSS